MPKSDPGEPGTNLPAEDDPADRSTLGDAFTMGGNSPRSAEEVERTRRRAYALWQRDGRPAGTPDQYWYQAEIDLREPVTAQALAARTGLNIDEAQDLIDRLGPDWELLEQAAASRS